MKRILVVFARHLVAAAVESLLSPEENISIINIPYTNGNVIIKEIKNFQPHVIILDDNAFMHDKIRLLELMEAYSELSIVIVSGGSNRVQLYAKSVFDLQDSSDLISAILA